MTPPATSQDAIVIGIDFGTTFSGVAWAFSGDPDQVEVITSWEAELAYCSDLEKVPSKICYDIFNDEEAEWGYSIKPGSNPLQWFKLLLLDEKDVPADIASSVPLREARRLHVVISKDSTEIIASYLQSLWNHSIETIKRSVGAALLESCVFHVVLTIPAIWPPYAQRRMKMAAELSGILTERPCGKTTLRFISEPEAAALATIRDLSKRPTTKAGDTLVVCDAGGGTVDLISYIVESTDPFVVKECVNGEGGLCGGLFLDEAFIKLLQQRAPGVWDKLDAHDKSKFLNENWEHGIKPQFEDGGRTWLIDLPVKDAGQPERYKKRMAIELTSLVMIPQQIRKASSNHVHGKDILSVFSPIIDKIKTLVNNQVSEVFEKYSVSPKYIALVGGFGRNSFLHNQLREAFNSTILQSRGNKPWTAICRGAVFYGLSLRNISTSLQVKVEARIARMSYGVVYNTTWETGKFLKCDKVWNEEEQEYEATNQIKWFLKRGDQIDQAEPIRHSYYRLYEKSIKHVTEEIFCSSAWPPPSRYDPSTVQQLCTISWNKKFKSASLPTWTNKIGKIYRKLSFDIEMSSEGGYLDFAVFYKGKRVGGEGVEVDFE